MLYSRGNVFFHLSTAYSFDLACTHRTGLLHPYLNFTPRLSTMSGTSSKSSSLDLAQIDSVDIVNPDDAYILSILNDPLLSLLERNNRINRLIGITRQRSLLHQEVMGLGSLPSSDNLLSLFVETDYNAPAPGTSLQLPRSLYGPPARKSNFIKSPPRLSGYFLEAYPDVFVATSGDFGVGEVIVLGSSGIVVKSGGVSGYGTDFLAYWGTRVDAVGAGDTIRLLLPDHCFTHRRSLLRRLQCFILGRFLRSMRYYEGTGIPLRVSKEITVDRISVLTSFSADTSNPDLTDLELV